eukprot:NODE_257_length_12663_cov_0.723655.p8 type:complete len:217 gc:universal NODE_257_length_12663_cov_0.723655:6173-5523(-)
MLMGFVVLLCANGDNTAYHTAAAEARKLLIPYVTEPTVKDLGLFYKCMIDLQASNCFDMVELSKLIRGSNDVGDLFEDLEVIYTNGNLVQLAQEHDSTLPFPVEVLNKKFGIESGAPNAIYMDRRLKKRAIYGVAAVGISCIAAALLALGFPLVFNVNYAGFGNLAAEHEYLRLVSELFWFALGLVLYLYGGTFAAVGALLFCCEFYDREQHLKLS